jgi:hypothetical protein
VVNLSGFLFDFRGKLIDVNFELQGRNKCIAEMMSKVSSYKIEFDLTMIVVSNNTCHYFSNMQDIWNFFFL